MKNGSHKAPKRELVSLKVDYVFKEAFSHEKVRKYFLSDVLDIPLKDIRSVKLTTPHLWKKSGWQKESILDMAIDLNGDADVAFELQVRLQKYWTKRQLFYLAKMFTGSLKAGHNYDKLRRCISIGILNFNLTDGEEYHNEYRLRTKNGKELTDLFEIHIIELRKSLQGTNAINDWIQLFNAESEEDLRMIKTENAGILEAMEVLRTMSLSKTLRYFYEERLKARRDRHAREEYVLDQGIALGEIRGMALATLQLLSTMGDVPKELEDKIMEEKELDTLKKWLKAAAASQNLQQFRESCGLCALDCDSPGSSAGSDF